MTTTDHLRAILVMVFLGFPAARAVSAPLLVVYPEAPEPYREAFAQMTSGIARTAGALLQQKVITATTSPEEFRSWLVEGRDQTVVLLGQKALYFFWYLDAQVTNGGFIQFYWNGYRRYLPTILKGLELLEDKDLIGLITKVDKEYLSNLKTFEKHRELNDWEPLYKNLTEFEKYDSIYYSIHDNTMKKIEKYIRLHPDDFVTLK